MITEQPESLPDGDLVTHLPDVQLDALAVHIPSLSVQEAADRLGVTAKTIRRRIKQGTLRSFKMPTSQGFEWRVQLDTQDGHVDTQPSTTGDYIDIQEVDRGVQVPTQHVAPAAEVLKALDLAEQLRRDNAALVARNEQLAGQVGFLQAKVQDQERQIALLMAPKDEMADVTPEKPPFEPDPPTASERVSWWRMLFGP
jgi:excisionase family DNA binding protein